MSGPVRPPLTVEESDGSVVVRPANTIKFNDADFTVAKSGNEATISIDSTGTGAALTATEIGFGDGSNLLTGDSVFTYTTPGSLPTVTLGDSTLQDAGGNFKLTGKDNLQIMTNSTYGSIKFYPATGATSAMNIDYIGGVTINPTGSATGDVVITGDTVTNLLKTDASQDNIGIGVTPSSDVERLHIQGTGTDDMVRIESSDAGSGSAPDIVFYRSSASPAANDYLGRIDFRGKDSAAADLNYGVIAGQITDPTNTSEDGAVVIKAAVNGDTNLTQPNATFKASGTTFNDGGISALDFLVKGANKNMIFVDAGQDNVGIGTSAPSSGVERLHIKGAGQTAPMVLIESEDDPGTASSNPVLQLYNSSTPGMNLKGGELRFSAKNDAGSEYIYGSIGMTIRDSTANEDGSLEIRVAQNGAENTVEYMRIGTATQRVFINPGEGNIDTQISSENLTQALFVNAGNDNVGIGTDPDSGVERLHVKGTGASDPIVRIESTDIDANAGPIIDMYRNSATPYDNDLIGKLEFSANDAGGAKHVLASIKTILRDEAAGGEDGCVVFEAAQFGSDAVEFMRYGLDPAQSNRQVIINNSNTSYVSFLVKGSSAGIISTDPSGNNFNVNPFGHSSVDMIVQGDTDTRLIRTDASEDVVGMGADPVAGGAKLQVDADCTHYYHVDALYTANHDVSVYQAHGCVLQMKTGSGTGVFNLPAAEAGMNLICINTGAGMNFTVDTGDTLNGVTDGSLTSAITTTAAGVRLICIATNTWVAYPLNPLATS